MAVVFPIGLEVFGNCSSCVAAAGSGGSNGTGNPAAGTTESWTMSTGYTSFPTATFNASTTFTNPSATPPGNYFYIRDPADTTNEIVLVYSGGGGTTTWYVQRGMNGATVAHSSGATWVQVISPYTLQNFKQAPGNLSSAVTMSTTTLIVLASYAPTVAEVSVGTSWRAIAYAGGVGWTGGVPTLEVALYWGGSGSVGGTYTPGTQLATILTNSNSAALTPTTVTATNAGYSVDVEGNVTLVDATHMTANLNMWYNGANVKTGLSASVVNTASSSPFLSTSSPISVSLSGSPSMFLVGKWNTLTTTATATWQAPVIFRDT